MNINDICSKPVSAAEITGNQERNHARPWRKFFKGVINVVDNLFKTSCSYRPGEMHISGPRSSIVSASTFGKNLPDALKPYEKNGVIRLNKMFYLKSKISYVSSVDASRVKYDLSSRKDDDRELIKNSEYSREYINARWDYTQKHAWD